jgi:pimeloyl-ACP methyl ester carboxylesterase
MEEPGKGRAPFRGMFGPRWIWFAAAIVWLTAVSQVSVLYLNYVQGLYDRTGPPVNWNALVASVAALLVLFVVAFLVLWHVSKTLTKRERASKAERGPHGPEAQGEHPPRKAILIVHGMGVQDRYQMLSDFRQGIAGYSADHEVEPVEETLTGKTWCTFRVASSKPGSESHLVDVHECFWGHHFNGVTKFHSTVIFAAKTLYKFAPTLFTRLYPKRLSEALWVGLALSLLGAALFGIYGGFRLSALRLQYFEAIADNQVLPSREKNEELGLDSRTRYAGLNWEGPRPLWIFNDSRPTYGERLEETGKFLALSYTSLWRAILKGEVADPKTKDGVLIPIQKPFEALGRHPIQNLVAALIYSAAFALTVMSFLWFVSAQWSLLKSDFRGPHANREALNYAIGFSNWRNSTFDSLRKGVVPLILLLALDPVLELVLVQLFMTAGLLVLLYKGLQYWMTNFLGDVEIYANTNENSSFWKAREAATTEIQKKIYALLNSRDLGGNLEYGCVIVVAHSLGSVIALQAIRRIGVDEQGGPGREPQLRGIGAFVTIGSPLRKFRQLFRFQPYKWAFAEFNVERDRVIFRGEEVSPHGPVPWHNFWYSSDIFADPLAFIPIGKLKSKLQAAAGPEEEAAVLREHDNPADLDRTGFQVGKAFRECACEQIESDREMRKVSRDHWLGFRWGIWTHSDYWLDPKFVDKLLHITLACGCRGNMLDRELAKPKAQAALPLVLAPESRQNLLAQAPLETDAEVDYGETGV